MATTMPPKLWSLAPCIPFVFRPDEIVGMRNTFPACGGTLYDPVADFVFARRQRPDDCVQFDDDLVTGHYVTK